MIKTATRLMAATAALGLVAAPIVAQANTRAGDSGSVYSVSNAAPGLGRAAAGEGQEEGSGLAIPLGIAAVALIGVGIYFAADDDDCASPGAC